MRSGCSRGSIGSADCGRADWSTPHADATIPCPGRATTGRHQLESLSDADPAAELTGGGDGGLPDSEPLRLLTHWTRLVCAHYGLAVHNLSASFGDGRAYCLLVHHYQPTLLPRHAVSDLTSLTAAARKVR